MTVHNVVIVGSGPAGLTAALYAARANLDPLVVAGYEAGGQLMITTDVENYPGFPEGIMGPELMEKFRKQAERFGTKFVDKDVTSVDFSRHPLTLDVEGEKIRARAVILATGASAKWLGLANETRLRGHGVSACATCDGFFFKGKEVAVVGGGDTAMEEAMFLTKFATKVHVIHRRDEFRASKIMQQRVLSDPKITVTWDTTVDDVLGEKTVEALALRNVKTGATSKLPVQGLFLAIGHAPNTAFLKGAVRIDEKGYVVTTNEFQTRTTARGVFVAGDVFDSRYRQAVTAAGSGCKAAIDAERWLHETHGTDENTETNW
ncbi:MAG TPA: thioredoxin-disulfide reductase [Candidatus Thermoplasmatota archaeon]|nr:thioredoxin-disulfide reductase [Candidatus Thermoplasmatota archaeon]